MRFNDRLDAGRRLGTRLEYLRGTALIVLGLPRGGVPVAAMVADALDAPLDVIAVRKLGAPQHPEYAIGALGEGGVRVLDADSASALRLAKEDLAAVERAEEAELARRSALFRQGGTRLDLEGRTVVIVDDGIATGATAKAACRSARARGATRIILAVPVAPSGWDDDLQGEADELIALYTPDSFFAVGQFYTDFSQTSDDEVSSFLGRARGSGNDDSMAQ